MNSSAASLKYIFILSLVFMACSFTTGFALHAPCLQRRLSQLSTMKGELDGSYNETETIASSYKNDTEFFELIEQSPDLLNDDLTWRVEKMRLEEQNTKRFLKAGPRFLPYEECRKWVQAWNRWDNEEDWKRWIDEGEKRNSYIPARPDEYYGNRNEWISWAHFLGKTENLDSMDDAFQ
jgi:hypothetical protein